MTQLWRTTIVIDLYLIGYTIWHGFTAAPAPLSMLWFTGGFVWLRELVEDVVRLTKRN
jgi:hypothetical protein